MTGTKGRRRGPYNKPRVPVPPPEWLAADPGDRRSVTQEEAARITGASPAVVSRWAHRRAPIGAQALQLLQLHCWGCLLPREWVRRGVVIDGDRLVTDTGLRLGLSELQAYAWLQSHHRQAVAELERRMRALEAAQAPPVPLAVVIPLESLREARARRRRPPETKSPA